MLDFSNMLFLFDESLMVGNIDMVWVYVLIVVGGGRVVVSGDMDQLQVIVFGQFFCFQQMCSVVDVVIMKEIVCQMLELWEVVYSLINWDVERVLFGFESVKLFQVLCQEGVWVLEYFVMEFSYSQEVKLVEVQQKVMLKGEVFLDVFMILYEVIVCDYIGRILEVWEQMLIVMYLNEDWCVLNSMIYDVWEKVGELGKEQVMVFVLNIVNICDGELCCFFIWEIYWDVFVLVDNVYYWIVGISKDDGLIILQDVEGNMWLIFFWEVVVEGVILYILDIIRVGIGDWMCFMKSDWECGYVVNSVWMVIVVFGDSVMLLDGQQIWEICFGQEQVE